MTTETFKSIFVRDQFPQFFDFEESKLQLFMQYYYEWMETLGPDLYSRRMLSYNDIDQKATGYQQFDAFLKNEFMKNFPIETEVEERVLIKRIKDFYRAKGTTEAVILLFRILYNETIEVDFPGRFILRASDGKWTIDLSMKVVLLTESITDISDYDFVIGETSKAEAKIESMSQTVVAGVIETTIFYSHPIGTFVVGEFLKSKLTGERIAKLTQVIVSPGRWTNTDGWLSSDKKLQDNYFYQEFSYTIKSGIPTQIWSEPVNQLVHPAGTIVFGEYQLIIDIDSIIDVNKNIDKLYSKTLDFTVDFFSLMTFDLESEQNQGSVSGKYIIIYDFEEYYRTLNAFQFTYLSQNGDFTDANNLRSDTQFASVGQDDIIEVVKGNRNFFLKVLAKSNNSHIVSYNPYPYGNSNNNTMRLYDNGINSKIETYLYKNNYGLANTGIAMSTFNSFDNLRGVEFDDIRAIAYEDLNRKMFIYANTHNFNSEHIVNNSIIRIVNNINSNTNVYYIKTVYQDHLMQIKNEEYLTVPSNNLTYTIINI
jgi:hypothetical protein